MEIVKIKNDKRRFIPLLLLGDEQVSMIERYLERGEVYALYDHDLKGVCVVTDEGNGVAEIKNISVAKDSQRKGYGKHILEFIENNYRSRYSVLQVGTGDSGMTIPFYEAFGFSRSHIIKNFFTENYDHPIYENGIQLTDMVFLRKNLQT